MPKKKSKVKEGVFELLGETFGSQDTIAKICGITPSAVRSWFSRKDIPTYYVQGLIKASGERLLYSDFYDLYKE